MPRKPAARSSTSPNALEYMRFGLEAAKAGAPAILVWTMGSILAIIFLVIPSSFAAQRADVAAFTFTFGAIVLALLGWLAVKNPAAFLLQYRWRVVQQPMRNEKLVQGVIQEFKKVLAVAADAFESAVP